MFDPSARRLPAELFERTRRAVFRRHWLGGLAASALAGLGAGVCVLPGMMIAKRVGAGIPVTFVLSLAGALVLFAPLLLGVVLPITRRMYAAGLVRYVLSQGHCPTCGYSLGGVTEAHGGIVVCPECGSAWGAQGRNV